MIRIASAGASGAEGSGGPGPPVGNSVPSTRIHKVILQETTATMVSDVQHILTWCQCCYYLFFMSSSETVRTLFLGQSLMLTSVNYGHASELFKNVTIQSVYVTVNV